MQPGRRGWEAGVPIFVEHWGNNLQFYPNFALYSTLGDERRPRFFSGKQIKWRPKKGLHQKWNTFSPNSGKDQKKRSSPKMEHFFPRIQVKTKKKGFHQNWNTFFPRIQVETFAQTQTRVKLLGGCSYRPYSNYWGGHFPTYPPRVPAPLLRGLQIPLVIWKI